MSRTRFRLRHRRDDRGQSLVLVLLVTMLAMIIMGTATTALISGIKPAKNSLLDGMATAAAEAGLEDFLAKLNQACGHSPYDCDDPVGPNFLIQGKSNTVDDATYETVPTPAGVAASKASFKWKVAVGGGGSGRVVSTGRAPMNSAGTQFRSITLVADVNEVPSFADFQYYTKFETYSPDFLKRLWSARTIAVVNAHSGLQIPNSTGRLSWTTGVPDSQLKVCQDLFYPNSDGPGRGTTGAYPSNTAPPSASSFTDYAWYQEPATFTPGTFGAGGFTATGSNTSAKHYDACDVMFEGQMVFDGSLYTQDAYAVGSSNGTGCTNNNPNQYPQFNGKAKSLWDGNINGVPDPYAHKYTSSQTLFRTLDSFGYGTNTNWKSSGNECDNFPELTGNKLELPDNTHEALKLDPCIFTGPTRIKVVNTIAYITSPMTDANNPPCLEKKKAGQPVESFVNTSTGNVSGGLVNYPLDLTTKPLIYVQSPVCLNGGSPGVCNHSAATTGNRIFDMTASVSPPAGAGNVDNLAYASTGAVATSCAPVTPSTSNQAVFDCDLRKNATDPLDLVGSIKGAVDPQLNDPTTYPSSTWDPTAAITSVINTSSPRWRAASGYPATMAKNDYYYQLATVTHSSTTTPNVPGNVPSLATTVGFLQKKAGVATYTKQQDTWTVQLNKYTCTTNGGCNNTNKLPAASPQINNTLTRTTYTANAGNTNPRYSWPWFDDGSCANTGTYQAACRDATNYQTNYGDAFVEGTLQGSLPIVAEHDIFVTGDLKYHDVSTSSNSAIEADLQSTSDAYAIVAGHDVRVYRPITCQYNDPSAITTAGYCPDDFYGTDTTPVVSWPNNQVPDWARAYVGSSAPSLACKTVSAGLCTATKGPSDDSYIFGVFFSLGAIDPETCPDHTGNSADVCQHVGGELMVDNVFRGPDNGNIHIIGGLYQYHRGATKLQYAGHPQGSNNQRPGMTLNYLYDNMRQGQDPNGGFRVWFPKPKQAPSGSTTWTFVSVSTRCSPDPTVVCPG